MADVIRSRVTDKVVSDLQKALEIRCVSDTIRVAEALIALLKAGYEL